MFQQLPDGGTGGGTHGGWAFACLPPCLPHLPLPFYPPCILLHTTTTTHSRQQTGCVSPATLPFPYHQFLLPSLPFGREVTILYTFYYLCSTYTHKLCPLFYCPVHTPPPPHLPYVGETFLPWLQFLPRQLGWLGHCTTTTTAFHHHSTMLLQVLHVPAHLFLNLQAHLPCIFLPAPTSTCLPVPAAIPGSHNLGFCLPASSSPLLLLPAFWVLVPFYFSTAPFHPYYYCLPLLCVLRTFCFWFCTHRTASAARLPALRACIPTVLPPLHL